VGLADGFKAVRGEENPKRRDSAEAKAAETTASYGQMEQLKSILKAVNFYCGYYTLVDRVRKIKDRQGRLLVLTYHNISDEPKPGTVEKELFDLRPSVTKRQFESHLKVLKKRFRVVPLPDIVREMKENGRLGNDSVAITFDDGYQSFYHLAFPLLRKYGFSATVFLPTDFVNSSRMFWWDALLQIVFYAVPQGKSVTLLTPLIGEKLASQFCSTGNDVGRKRRFLESLESHLRDIEDGQRREKIKNLKEILLSDRNVESTNLKTLTWDQVGEMVREGISFGSHTCSHLNLKFAPLEKVEQELSQSKEIIEENAKAKVVCFAYPYQGDPETDFKVKPVLKNLGYECACTCLPGVNLSGSDPFFLRRMTLPLTASCPIIARELLLDYSERIDEKSFNL
jgi:peptidoglycan/xylan/chitin deacetylase (PgdA/CDA1 family)